MKETNSMIMTARGKKYIENELRDEGDSVHDSSLGDSFQFHMGPYCIIARVGEQTGAV